METAKISKQTKHLGGWGLLVLVGASLLGSVIPLACIISLASTIVTLIGYFRASDELGEPEIKRNIIKAILVVIIGVVILIISSVIITVEIGKEDAYFEDIASSSIVVMLVFWIILLVANWFWYKANVLLSLRTNINLFKTGGLLIFVGTILGIILIGILISMVGSILLIIAWFSVPERTGTV